MRHARLVASALVVAMALALGACGADEQDGGASSAPSGPPVRIGTKDFTEQFILGELYRQALEAHGFRVELKGDIGSSEIIHQALTGGALDMYPEYVGVLLSEIANVRTRPRSPQAAYRAAKAFEERHGFTLLAMTPFSDSNALAVKPAFSRSNSVRSIGDLGRLKGKVKIGAPPEFRTRVEGMIGLKDRYRLRNLQATPLAIDGRYAALDAGRVHVAAVFTTEGQLADTKSYTVLDDPRGVFALQHVAPVIGRAALRKYGPKLAATVDAVSERLTTVAMREMNAAVDTDGRKPAAVAREFLRTEGLLSG